MDEKELEILRITTKVLDDANKLHIHTIKWGCAVIISLGLIFGICFNYSTYMSYNYDYQYSNTNVNENTNKNINEGD